MSNFESTVQGIVNTLAQAQKQDAQRGWNNVRASRIQQANKELQDSYNEEVAKINKLKTKAIADLNAKYDKDLASLKAQYDAKKVSEADLKAQYEAEVAADYNGLAEAISAYLKKRG